MMLLSYLACTPHRVALKIPGQLRNPIVFNAWLLAAMVASSLGNLGYAGPAATGKYSLDFVEFEC